ncbi:MAG: serine O-acetyltransferase [Lewinella sp.]
MGIPLVVPITDILLLWWFSSQVGNKVEIGNGVKFAHPLGIVLGEESVIGDDCIIYQNVTLGGHSRKRTGPKYPRLETGVTVFPNSVLVGGITVGANATVGACSMVNKSVAPGATVGGVPAKVIKVGNP